jgi:hypothetical protein
MVFTTVKDSALCHAWQGLMLNNRNMFAMLHLPKVIAWRSREVD